MVDLVPSARVEIVKHSFIMEHPPGTLCMTKNSRIPVSWSLVGVYLLISWHQHSDMITTRCLTLMPDGGLKQLALIDVSLYLRKV